MEDMDCLSLEELSSHLLSVYRGLSCIFAGRLEQLAQAAHQHTKEDDAQHKDENGNTLFCRGLRGYIPIAHCCNLQKPIIVFWQIEIARQHFLRSPALHLQ